MFFSQSGSVKKGKKVFNGLYYFPEILVLDCNQYIIEDKHSGELALFDAGNGVSLNGLFEGMKLLDLEPENITKVFVTHEHVDHVLGLYPLMERLASDPPIIYAYGITAEILEKGDESQIFPGNLGISPSMFGINIKKLKVHNLEGLNEINIGSDFTFKIYYTPGHSLGSVCYYEPEKKILICGDLVFKGGSFGRYDFPGGSLPTLIKSIKFVSELDVKYLLPGHMGISDNGNQQINLSYRMIQSIGHFY
ncbi:MAG: MBL fold metallo-hydrolase [Promethearchaeia archaeon]